MKTLVVARYELRRHLGRGRWQLAMAAMTLLPSLMWVAPSGGSAMLTVGGARVAYDSAVLAAMIGANLMVWLGLAGFYLVRANAGADVASGAGGVLAALPVPDRSFVAGRWLAAFGAIMLLGGAALLGVLGVHARHLDVPVDLAACLRIWLALLLPCAAFSAGMAMLCDAWRPLLGRAGDLLFFVLWLACSFAMEAFWKDAAAGSNPLQLLDFAGHYSVMIELARVFHGTALGTEHSEFDPALGVLALPAGFWPAQAVLVRCASTLLALAPLWLAAHRFHRYSPDLFRTRIEGGNPLRCLHALASIPPRLVNRACAPLLRLAMPVVARASRWPGAAGAVAAEFGHTLLRSPSLLGAVLACTAAALLCAAEDVHTVLLSSLALWGLLASEISTREHAGGTVGLALSFPGGARRRALRHLGATALAGLLFCLGVLLRTAGDAPLQAALLGSGLLLASSAALLLGYLTRTGRSFVALLLAYLWLADRMNEVAALDTFGMHGLLGVQAVAWQLAAAVICTGLAVTWVSRGERV